MPDVDVWVEPMIQSDGDLCVREEMPHNGLPRDWQWTPEGMRYTVGDIKTGNGVEAAQTFEEVVDEYESDLTYVHVDDTPFAEVVSDA